MAETTTIYSNANITKEQITSNATIVRTDSVNAIPTKIIPYQKGIKPVPITKDGNLRIF